MCVGESGGERFLNPLIPETVESGSIYLTCFAIALTDDLSAV